MNLTKLIKRLLKQKIGVSKARFNGLKLYFYLHVSCCGQPFKLAFSGLEFSSSSATGNFDKLKSINPEYALSSLNL